MLVGENSLGRALSVGGSQDRARRQRLRWTGAMAASYALDVLFLALFAAAVHDTMRATDVFGRYGGEEFMLILVGTPADTARDAVERIRAVVAGLDWRAIVGDTPVTLSAGVAACRKGEVVEELLQRADRALYEAKHGGRNRTVLGEA